jgi:hypothetical protein
MAELVALPDLKVILASEPPGNLYGLVKVHHILAIIPKRKYRVDWGRACRTVSHLRNALTESST